MADENSSYRDKDTDLKGRSSLLESDYYRRTTDAFDQMITVEPESLIHRQSSGISTILDETVTTVSGVMRVAEDIT